MPSLHAFSAGFSHRNGLSWPQLMIEKAIQKRSGDSFGNEKTAYPRISPGIRVKARMCYCDAI
jgi:hypothetical protein